MAVAIRLVEIDVLDVEGLAHVGAAVAQELHDGVTVGDRIEMGLDRVRLGRDLTERERCCEDLDEDRVHRECANPETRPSQWRDKTAFSRSRRRRRIIIARISSIYDSLVPPIEVPAPQQAREGTSNRKAALES